MAALGSCQPLSHLRTCCPMFRHHGSFRYARSAAFSGVSGGVEGRVWRTSPSSHGAQGFEDRGRSRYPDIGIDIGITGRAENLLSDSIDWVLQVVVRSNLGLVARSIGKPDLTNVSSSPSSGRVENWEWIGEKALRSAFLRGHVTLKAQRPKSPAVSPGSTTLAADLRPQIPSGKGRACRRGGRVPRCAEADELALFAPSASFPQAPSVHRLARGSVEEGTLFGSLTIEFIQLPVRWPDPRTPIWRLWFRKKK